MGRRRLASGVSAPAGGIVHAGMRPPLSSSQSPLSSVSLAVTSSASLVPAMLARTRSLRCSGSPHRAGRGGGPNAKTAPAPLHPRGTSAPTPWAWALLLSPPRGARRGPLSVLAEKKTGRTRKGYAASVSGKAANGCAIARSKRKGRLGALRCSGPPRDGGRRIGACSDLGLPSGTLGPSARSILLSRGGWCGGHRGARTHLSSFSFTVSHCGAPSISVTSVPLVPPSARSACPQGARRIRKRQSRQRLRSRYALPRRA